MYDKQFKGFLIAAGIFSLLSGLSNQTAEARKGVKTNCS